VADLVLLVETRQTFLY